MKRFLLPALIALSLAACTTPPTVYGPATSPTGMGYRETRIETDRYRVSFRANADVKREGSEHFALQRAAEITLRDGYDWFRVVDRTGDVRGYRGGGSSVGVGGATTSGGYRSHTSVGMGVSIDLTPDQRQYDTSLEILLGHGRKPSDPDAYDARGVLGR